MSESKPKVAKWRNDLWEVIFEADTPAGKAFDLVLLVLIVLSIVAVSLDSVAEYDARFGVELRTAEWIFTVVFTIEYVVRLICVRRPLRYAISFFGIVDLLAILPTYASLFVAGTQTLLVIRALRLLRVFRVLKLAHFVGEAQMLSVALYASTRKIIVFLGTVVTLVLIIGALMYLVEGAEHGFTSIPQSAYWAVVTMTTVGYGDIAPGTTLGKVLASVVMITGYAIIAVPTGIVTVEMANAHKEHITSRACAHCATDGHDHDAKYCKFCGEEL